MDAMPAVFEPSHGRVPALETSCSSNFDVRLHSTEDSCTSVSAACSHHAVLKILAGIYVPDGERIGSNFCSGHTARPPASEPAPASPVVHRQSMRIDCVLGARPCSRPA